MKTTRNILPTFWRFDLEGGAPPIEPPIEPPPAVDVLMLTSISPNKGSAGRSLAVAFSGTGFDGTNLQVHFSEELGIHAGAPTAITATSFVSIFSITAGAQKGPRFVSVSTDEGGRVGNLQFNIKGGGNR